MLDSMRPCRHCADYADVESGTGLFPVISIYFLAGFCISLLFFKNLSRCYNS